VTAVLCNQGLAASGWIVRRWRGAALYSARWRSRQLTRQSDEGFEVSRVVAHIHMAVLALVCALMGGIGLFTMTAWLVIKDGTPVGPHLGLLSQYFPGYSVTWGGSFVGLFYSAVVGGVGGWLIAAIYHSVPRLSKISAVFVYRPSKDRAALSFTWATWVVMLLIALAYFRTYAQNVPLTEDWLLVPALTGHQSDFMQWLWAPNNEHRLPLPRLVMLGILKASGGDFRACMLFNILLLAVISGGMLRAARRLRGGRSRLTDAFFPLAFLHMGNWENMLWAWQLAFVMSIALVCVVLLVMIGNQGLLTRRGSIISGACLVLLPLTGANGLLFVPPLALWTGLLGFHTIRTNPLARREGQILITFSAIALLVVRLYFVGFSRPAWTGPGAGAGQAIRAATQFAALAFGPAARSCWDLFVAMDLSILLATSICLVRSVMRSRYLERLRAIGILVFFATGFLYAAALGYGRGAVVSDVYGQWPLRYVLLAVPQLCVVYFICEFYGPARLRSVVQGLLFGTMLVLIPLNTAQGLKWGKWYETSTRAVMEDLKNGSSSHALAARQGDFLFHSIHREELDV